MSQQLFVHARHARRAWRLDGALLLLASDAGCYFTGQTILVDGGISAGAVRALLSAGK